MEDITSQQLKTNKKDQGIIDEINRDYGSDAIHSEKSQSNLAIYPGLSINFNPLSVIEIEREKIPLYNINQYNLRK